MSISVGLLVTLFLYLYYSYITHIKVNPPQFVTAATLEDGALAYFNKHKETIDTLIVGDSHPDQALIAGKLPKNWFKATHAIEDIELSLIKIQYYIHASRNIKYILIPLDYQSMNGNMGISREEYLIYENPSLYTLVRTNKLFNDFNRKLVVNWLFTKLNKRFLTNEWKAPLPIPLVQNTSIVDINSAQYHEEIKLRVAGQLFADGLSPQSIDSFNTLVALCATHHIKLIGIRYPVPQAYTSYIKKNNFDKIDVWIEKNRFKMSHVFNYVSLYDGNPTYFTDTDHLSPIGALHFTQQLVNDVNCLH